jgi:hypothetical protein
VRIAKKLLSRGDTLEEIAALTDLTIEEILQIEKNYQYDHEYAGN